MINEIFASDAFAQTTGAAANSSGFMSFVPLVLIFLIFYFLLIRPQQKKFKEHQIMVNNLKVGNKVCTSSGIIGVVADIDEKNSLISLEIAKDVIIQVLKNSVSEVFEKEKNDSEKKFVIKKDKKSKK